MHTSVFLEEAVTALQVQQDGRYIDATFGEGGHAKKIKELGGHVLGIDVDPDQVAKQAAGEIKVIQGNFSQIETIATEQGFNPVDGVLFDLGLSMEQLAHGKRGLSYNRLDEPLDMRMGDTETTAQQILEKMSDDDLREVIVTYSEDVNADAIAKEILIARKTQRFATVSDLVTTIDRVLEEKHIQHPMQKRQIHARIFQALRIEVNNEFETIRLGLQGSMNILKPGGRIVIITFHSLEDRIVKLFGRSQEDKLKQDRIKINRNRKLQSFERSANLRIFIKQ